MFNEIIFSAEFTSFTVRRTPKFTLNSSRRGVTFAEFELHDEGYEAYKTLFPGAPIKIIFGYRNAEQAEFNGEITHYSTPAADTTRITACGAEYAFVKTRVAESYNDEEPAAIIKQLAGLAGVESGRIEAPGDSLPHIIFNNKTIWEAFSQLRRAIIRNGCRQEQDYWVYGGKLCWGGYDNGSITKAAVRENILNHTVCKTGNCEAELPLTPRAAPSELIEITDALRGVHGRFKIYRVRHSYAGVKTRTFIEYRS